MLKQRLDIPYIKKDNKLVKSNWDEVLEVIRKKLVEADPNKIGGHVGDLVSLENSLAFKKFFKYLKSNNLEFREKKFYINPSDKMNYIFNSSIKGIEESDLIILIGTNPRHEATILNARIRKAFIKNKTPIYSIGDPGDLTYEYKIIGKNTNDIKKIINNESEISSKISLAKKPIFIIGESALELKSGQYLFEELKNFLLKKNFINNNWNALNILVQNASTVGLLDLEMMLFQRDNNFFFFDKLKKKEFDFLYLLGSDNLDFKKSDEFIIYQGSHGDKGAEIADIILPSAAYTEQNGLYINLEGRVQECKKASYPIGDSLEDWKIFNSILKKMKKNDQLSTFENLKKEAINSVKNFSSINDLPSISIEKSEIKILSF